MYNRTDWEILMRDSHLQERSENSSSVSLYTLLFFWPISPFQCGGEQINYETVLNASQK